MRVLSNLLGVIAILGLLAAPARADDKQITKFTAKPAPSGPLKAYKGPEGEVIVLVEANEGKEILVHFKNLGGELEGKTLRYLLEDLGQGDKNVYLDWKRGSRPYRRTMMTMRDKQWRFFSPINPKIEFALSYSEATSEKFKLDDVLKTINP